MTEKIQEASYRTYWSTWFVLLMLTLVMILVGFVSMPRGFIIALLIPAMLAKAALISGNFMHLRFERVTLALAVAVGILFTAGALFFGIAPDGTRILNLSPR